MVYIFLALTDSSKLHSLPTSFKLNNILLAKSLVAQLAPPVVFNIDIQDSYPSFSIISIELYKINNKNILLCPRASTNLISVQKLNKDNNRVCCIDSIELDANESIVKGKKKKKTLGDYRFRLGKTENGLYPFIFSIFQISKFCHVAFPDKSVSLLTWHARVGHPSHPVLQSLLFKFSLPCNSSSNYKILFFIHSSFTSKLIAQKLFLMMYGDQLSIHQ